MRQMRLLMPVLCQKQGPVLSRLPVVRRGVLHLMESHWNPKESLHFRDFWSAFTVELRINLGEGATKTLRLGLPCSSWLTLDVRSPRIPVRNKAWRNCFPEEKTKGQK